MKDVAIHLPLPADFSTISQQHWQRAVLHLQRQDIHFSHEKTSERVRALVECMGRTRRHVESVLAPHVQTRVGITWSPIREEAIAQAPWIILSGPALDAAAQYDSTSIISLWKNRPNTQLQDCIVSGTKNAICQLMYAEEHHHVYLQTVDPMPEGSIVTERMGPVALCEKDAHPAEFAALQFLLKVSHDFHMPPATVRVLTERLAAAQKFRHAVTNLHS
ncbi:hypothetical protein HYZ99_05060 [Candidatus Peregrinibacteria bacterium]|nr:hypothetical protein [Candidatus Peregrinibacteria bacterium]